MFIGTIIIRRQLIVPLVTTSSLSRSSPPVCLRQSATCRYHRCHQARHRNSCRDIRAPCIVVPAAVVAAAGNRARRAPGGCSFRASWSSLGFRSRSRQCPVTARCCQLQPDVQVPVRAAVLQVLWQSSPVTTHALFQTVSTICSTARKGTPGRPRLRYLPGRTGQAWNRARGVVFSRCLGNLT